jgi:dihydropyrimidinase
MADGFESGTRSAASPAATTMVMPFAHAARGAVLRVSVEAYQALAEGRLPRRPRSFHMIVTDPTPSVLGQELPALVGDGYTSFKVFMTYDDLVLSDRSCSKCSSVARQCGPRHGPLPRATTPSAS